MSEFEKVFGALASGGEYGEERRLTKLISLELTPDEAYIVDQCIKRSIGRAYAAIGKGLDELSPLLQVAAMPAMLDMFALNAKGLEVTMLEVLFGNLKPTPGCDCDHCGTIKALRDELTKCEDAANAAEQAKEAQR